MTPIKESLKKIKGKGRGGKSEFDNLFLPKRKADVIYYYKTICVIYLMLSDKAILESLNEEDKKKLIDLKSFYLKKYYKNKDILNPHDKKHILFASSITASPKDITNQLNNISTYFNSPRIEPKEWSINLPPSEAQKNLNNLLAFIRLDSLIHGNTQLTKHTERINPIIKKILISRVRIFNSKPTSENGRIFAHPIIQEILDQVCNQNNLNIPLREEISITMSQAKKSQ